MSTDNATPETPVATVATPTLAEQYDVELPARPASQPVPVAPPAAPKHSWRTLQMANELGFSKEEIDSSSPEQLDAAVYHANRIALQSAREVRAAQRLDEIRQVQPGTLPPGPSDLRVAPQVVSDAAGAEYSLDLGDENLLDPSLVAVLKKIGTQLGVLTKENKSIKAELEQYRQAETGRQQETAAERIDRQFDLLSDKYSGRFGKGRGKFMKPGSSELLNRLSLVGLIDHFQGSIEERLERAAEHLFGKPAAPPSPPPAKPVPPQGPDGRFLPHGMEGRWANAGLQQPTQRESHADVHGRDRAIKAVKDLVDQVSATGGSGENGTTVEEFL